MEDAGASSANQTTKHVFQEGGAVKTSADALTRAGEDVEVDGGSKKRKLPLFVTGAPTDPKEEAGPPLTFAGSVVYITAAKLANALCTKLVKEANRPGEPLVVGFDIEWLVTFKAGDVRKTSLVQLCLEKRCYLLHLAAMNPAEMLDGLPEAVRVLLGDKRILKVGVGITNDGWKLTRDFGAHVEGLVCLSDMANERLLPAKRWSLKDLLARVSGSCIPKPESVRCGNWEKHPLSPAQRSYAVVDAYAGLVIYHTLVEMPLLTRSTGTKEPSALHPQPRSVGAVSVATALPTPAADRGLQPAKQLGPSKMNVYRLVRDGLSIEAVSGKMNLRQSTVSSYLYECLSRGGLPWEFEWLKIPMATALLVMEAAVVPPPQEKELPQADEGSRALPCTSAGGIAGIPPAGFGAALVQLAPKQRDDVANNAIKPADEITVFKAKKRRKGGVKAFFLASDDAALAPIQEQKESSAGKQTQPEEVNTIIDGQTLQEATVAETDKEGGSILPMKLKDIKAKLKEEVSYDDIRFVMLALHQGRLAWQGSAGGSGGAGSAAGPGAPP